MASEACDQQVVVGRYEPGSLEARARNLAGRIVFTSPDWAQNPDFARFHAVEADIRAAIEKDTQQGWVGIGPALDEYVIGANIDGK